MLMRLKQNVRRALDYECQLSERQSIKRTLKRWRHTHTHTNTHYLLLATVDSFVNKYNWQAAIQYNIQYDIRLLALDRTQAEQW